MKGRFVFYKRGDKRGGLVFYKKGVMQGEVCIL